jgi:hypothetical protein
VNPTPRLRWAFLVRVLQTRWMLLLLLLFLQLQFFTINMLNTRLRAPDAGWELRIDFIDDHIVPEGAWLIPYFLGLLATGAVPLWAAYVMPLRLFRQFMLAMTLAAAVSYAIYILLPTYVVKPEPDRVRGASFLAEALRTTYRADAAASSHNAAPSQHVFYAVLNMCFVIRFRPRPRVFWLWVTLAALISVSTVLTQRHNSPDLFAGYAVAVAAYYTGMWMGNRATGWLGDEDAPIVMLGRDWILRRLMGRQTDAQRHLTPVPPSEHSQL